jgi:hypothetical protein
VLPRVAHTRLAEGFDGLCKLPELFFSDELCRAVGREDLQEQAQRKHLLKVTQRISRGGRETAKLEVAAVPDLGLGKVDRRDRSYFPLGGIGSS